MVKSQKRSLLHSANCNVDNVRNISSWIDCAIISGLLSQLKCAFREPHGSGTQEGGEEQFHYTSQTSARCAKGSKTPAATTTRTE